MVSISGLVGHLTISVPTTRASYCSVKPLETHTDRCVRAPANVIQMVRLVGLVHGISLPSPNLKHVLVLSEMVVMV